MTQLPTSSDGHICRESGKVEEEQEKLVIHVGFKLILEKVDVIYTTNRKRKSGQ